MAQKTPLRSKARRALKDLIEIKELHLVTFGCGSQFDRRKFEAIENIGHIKPRGGLWASPVDAEYGWKEWSRLEQFGDLSTQFEFDFCGRVLTIDEVEDLNALPWLKPCKYLQRPDYEEILKAGVDAIYLTEKGEEETRFSDPNLYGWDCECVLVMNPDSVLSEQRSESNGP